MEDRIIDIVVEACNEESIRDNLNIDLLETDLLDSLAFITLISRLGKEFNIEIQPTQVPPDSWRTVGSIIELVKNYKLRV